MSLDFDDSSSPRVSENCLTESYLCIQDQFTLFMDNDRSQEGGYPYHPPVKSFGSPAAAFSFDPSRSHATPYQTSLIDPSITMGLKVLQLFAKVQRRRLVMESFLKLKLMYGLSLAARKQQSNNSFSSKVSSVNVSQPSRQSRFNYSIKEPAEESMDDAVSSKAKLLSNIMHRLKESSERKSENERISAEAHRRNMDDTVVQKLDNLERMLYDIKMQSSDSGRNLRPKPYANIRARAKGRSFDETPTRVVKPMTAFEPHDHQTDGEKSDAYVHRFNPHKYTVENAPIQERDQASQAGHVRISVEPPEPAAHNISKTNNRITEELSTIAAELNVLRKINQAYIKKNTLLLAPEESANTASYEETKWLKTEQSTDSRDFYKTGSAGQSGPIHSNSNQGRYLNKPAYQPPGSKGDQRQHTLRPANAFQRPGFRGDNPKPSTAYYSQPHTYTHARSLSGGVIYQPVPLRKPLIVYETRRYSREKTPHSHRLHPSSQEPRQQHHLQPGGSQGHLIRTGGLNPCRSRYF